MPEPERRSALSRNMASDKDRKEIPERCPELTDEVKHTAIPVLDQQVGADVLDATIPLLEETFSLFEKISLYSTRRQTPLVRSLIAPVKRNNYGNPGSSPE